MSYSPILLGIGAQARGGLNNSAESAGYYEISPGDFEAVRWSPTGAMTVLQHVGVPGTSNYAVAINAFGESVGYSYTPGTIDAVLWSSPGTATILKNVGHGRDAFTRALATDRACRAIWRPSFRLGR